MAYDVGTAFLHIVPSFRDIEGALAAGARKIAKEVEGSVSDALPKGMEEGAKKAAKDAEAHGRRVGKGFTGAYADELRTIARGAASQLGEIQLKADPTQADHAIERLRFTLLALSDEKILLKVDDRFVNKTLLEARDRLREFQRAAEDTNLGFNAGQAADILDTIDKLDKDAKNRGGSAGGAYADAFTKSVEHQLRQVQDLSALPHLINTDDLETLHSMRDELKGMRHNKVGIDIDENQASDFMVKMSEQFDNLSKNSLSPLVRKDADAARQVVEKYFESIKTEAQVSAEKAALAQIDANAKAIKKEAEDRDRDYERLYRESILQNHRREVEADASEKRQAEAAEKAAQELLAREEKARQDALAREEKEKQDSYRRLFDQADLLNHRLDVEAEASAKRQAEAIFDKQFAGRVRNTLSSALERFPPVQIDADSSLAQRKLAELIAEIKSLRDQKIGVDIDEKTAETKLKGLISELDRLSQFAPSVEIRTNAAAAAGDIRQIYGASENAAAGIDDMGSKSLLSLSRLGALIALGGSIGSVIVPAAASAAFALSALGTMAASALAGVGVFALGINGISDAVKALDKAAQDQGKTDKTLGAQNKALASSTDQVIQSERSLANTRANVADAAITAAQRVADAQRAVTDARTAAAEAATTAARSEKDAEKDLTRAQADAADVRKDLNKALRDAKNDMLELDQAVKQNALDQREANTSIMEEKEKLDKILSNPRATEIEKRNAQEAYDQRVLQLSDLKIKSKELAQQQGDYAKKGVEANDKVIAARKRQADADDKVKDSQQKVADAQAKVAKAQTDGARKVADAQRALATAQRAQVSQTRQGQFQIAQAMGAVTTAQRAQAQAVVSGAATSGAAVDNLNQTFGQLGPAGQAFAKFIFGLKGDFISLRDTAQAGLLPGIQDAITSLLPYLPKVQDFIGRIATEMGELFRQSAIVLQDPSWQRFFGYISDTAVPTMDLMFDGVMNVATGLADLFVALSPFNKQIGKGLLDLSQGFADWARNLTETTGYQKFLDYVAQVGPQVVDLFKNLTIFAGHLVEALAPIGAKIVNTFKDFFGFLAGIDVTTLTTLVTIIAGVATAILAVNTAVGLVKGIGQIINSTINPILGFFTRFKTGLSDASVNIQNAEINANRSLTRLERGAIRTSTLSKAAFGGLLSAGNLIGLAFSAVAIGGAILYNQSQKQKAKIEDLTTSLEGLGRAYRDTKSLTSEQVQDTITQNKNLTSLVKISDQYGIALLDVAKAADGNAAAQGRVADGYDRAIEQQKNAINNANAAAAFQNAFDPGSEAAQKVFEAQKAANTAGKERLKTLEAEKKSTIENYTQVNAQADAITRLKDAENGLASLRDQVLTPQERAHNAELAANQAQIDSLTKYVRAFGTAQGDAAAKADWLKEALQKQDDTAKNNQGLTISAIENSEAYAQQLNGLTSQVQQNKDAHDKDALSIGTVNTANLSAAQAADKSTKALLTANPTVLANRDALENAAKASRDMFVQDINLGVSVEEATKKHRDRITALEGEAKNLGFTSRGTNDLRGDVKDLITQYGGVPKTIITQMEAKKFDDAFAQLEMLNFIQQKLKLGEDASQAKSEWEAYKHRFDKYTYGGTGPFASKPQLLATGGPVRGPGSKTSDSVPIMASRGEFMQQAAAVDYYGKDLMWALNHRRIPRDLLPGFAGGGEIGFKQVPTIRQIGSVKQAASGSAPISISLSGMYAPTVQEIKDQIDGLLPDVSGGHRVGNASLAEIAESTARAAHASNKMLVALIEAGIVESHMQNLNYGDRDSLGFLQQRPSQGWGTAAQIMDPRYATRSFIRKAKRVDRKSYTPGELAQAVQVSGYPLRYGKQEANAYAILNALPPYVSGGTALGGGSGAGGYQWQIDVLRKQFGDLVHVNSTTGGEHAPNSWHYKGRAIDINPVKKIAQWIIDHYGKNTKELIDPWPGMMLKNGQYFKYSDALEKQHKNHIHWAYDQGGWLPPGATQVVNNTGKPEAVFTSAQFADIRALASVGSSAGSQTTYHMEFANTTLTPEKLRSMQQRQDAIDRLRRQNY